VLFNKLLTILHTEFCTNRPKPTLTLTLKSKAQHVKDFALRPSFTGVDKQILHMQINYSLEIFVLGYDIIFTSSDVGTRHWNVLANSNLCTQHKRCIIIGTYFRTYKCCVKLSYSTSRVTIHKCMDQVKLEFKHNPNIVHDDPAGSAPESL
jgi:hypothetical protein